MSRQKILRVKATFEVPFANVREGAVAYNALAVIMLPGQLAKVHEIDALEVTWSPIEETTRATPEPAKEPERKAAE